MGHHQKGVRERHGRSDLRPLHIDAIQWDFHFIRAAQAIGDDHRCPHYLEHKPVLVSSKEVIHSVGAGPGVEGIGIGEERLCSQFLELIHGHPDVIWAEIREVPSSPKWSFMATSWPALKIRGRPASWRSARSF
jgi:hypothetical protein